MLSEKVNSLMRLFFQLSCETLLILEEEHLFSLSRLDINRLMSDVTNLRSASSLPVKKIVSVDNLLQVYSISGMTRAGNGVIALLNSDIQLIAQLGKDEVLRLWEQLQKSKQDALLQQKQEEEKEEIAMLVANKISVEKENHIKKKLQEEVKETVDADSTNTDSSRNETFKEYLKRTSSQKEAQNELQEKTQQTQDQTQKQDETIISPASLLTPQELASLHEIIELDEDEENEQEKQEESEKKDKVTRNEVDESNLSQDHTPSQTKKIAEAKAQTTKKNLQQLIGENLVVPSATRPQTKSSEKNEKDFSIEHLLETNKEKNKWQNTSRSSNSIKQEHSLNGQLAIMTMEALPIPMLACDTNGEELFLNQDWQLFLKQKKQKLKTNVLLEQAKKIMFRLARDNKLDSQDAIIVENFSAYNIEEKKFLPYSVFLKAIRLHINETEQKTIGYLFYIIRDGQEKINVSSVSDNHAHFEKHSTSYSGKTLPDILKEKEKDVLLWAYHQAGENQSNAAMLLGIPRQTFSYKFNKYFQKQKELL